MVDTPADFYDGLADTYDLIFEDWHDAVTRQGHILSDLIARELGPGPHTILDCSCGIGTQAIGLSLLGHSVHGTDVSPRSVLRARREARERGVSIRFDVADFRHLDTQVEGTFDVVIAIDNSLPHMTTGHDLDAALASIRCKLRPGGLFIASIRDYDQDLITRPQMTSPFLRGEPPKRRVYFQVWDWLPDGNTYALHLFILHEDESTWRTEHHETTYRAITRLELSRRLAQARFEDVTWYVPPRINFYQPVVTARG